MPIDFACPACQKKLRVADESAGKNARCPSCGAIAPVPSDAPAGVGFGAADFSDPVPRAASGGSPSGGESDPFASFPQVSAAPTNPYAAPQIDFEPSAASATGVWRPAAVEAGEVISRSTQVWQKNLGILVGALLIVMGINWGLSLVYGAVLGGVGDAAGKDATLAMNFAFQLFVNAMATFLGIGSAQISLKLARGQRAEVADLFRGGSRFLPVIGVSILFGLALVAGFLLLLIPGFVVAVLFWPVYLLVVDEKAGVLDSFGKAYQFTKMNVGTTIVLAFASLGISLLGLLALCIGVIFAAPLASMLWTVGYLMMTGQIRRRSDVLAAGAPISLPGGR